MPCYGLSYRPTLLLVKGGAHRVAASLALGIDVIAEPVQFVGGATWDYGWFARKGMERSDLDRLMDDWRKFESSD